MKALSTKSRSKIQSFRELAVWRKSMQLAVDIYQLTRDCPWEKAFGLTSQLRRSVVSIPNKIAEGFGRMNRRELRHFLLIARGSVCEMQTQLELSRVLGWGNAAILRRAEKLAEETGKMPYSLLDGIRVQSG